MFNRNEILKPLGGEDTLRLMCGADGFEYYSAGISEICCFRTPKYSIEVSHYTDNLEGKSRWALVVYLKEIRFPHHRSSSIWDPDLLVRIFEWSTEYTLSF
jgi:hypothetical protein